MIYILGVEPRDLSLDSNIVNDLGADSLDSIELLMAAENKYGIKIPDEEAASISTVRDVCMIVLKKLNNPQ